MKTTIKITGMHCASCSTILTRALLKVPGVKSAVVNYSTEKALVDHDENQAPLPSLLKAIEQKGYQGMVLREGQRNLEEVIRKRELRDLQFNLLLSILFSLPALLLSMFFGS